MPLKVSFSLIVWFSLQLRPCACLYQISAQASSAGGREPGGSQAGNDDRHHGKIDKKPIRIYTNFSFFSLLLLSFLLFT